MSYYAVLACGKVFVEEACQRHAMPLRWRLKLPYLFWGEGRYPQCDLFTVSFAQRETQIAFLPRNPSDYASNTKGHPIDSHCLPLYCIMIRPSALRHRYRLLLAEFSSESSGWMGIIRRGRGASWKECFPDIFFLQ